MVVVSTLYKIVVFGLFIHLILLYAIFDIYYISPLVHGSKPFRITNDYGLASRVVVFSADGLRADSFFLNPEKSPFLHRLIRQNQSCWGISRSSVPTESRPGHVAMLAGFYEDVSAVTRGWKLNPLPFDSVFNRSKRSWSWGSPDIVPIFTHDIDSAYSQVYSPDLENFFSENSAELDGWVFNKVAEFFENATDSLRIDLHERGSLFFLHLLGLDVNGHGFKPHSTSYIDNILTVDAGISKTTEIFANFFRDDKTAFIFTSDHGMTDWGSHGAGTDAELLTPFVIWGSGVKSYPYQREINQVDISVAISAFLGNAIPMNNVGILPKDFFNASAKYLFQSSYANLKQMLEQFVIKRREKKSGLFSFLFKDFEPLQPSMLAKIDEILKDLRQKQRYEIAANICLNWIPIVREGLYYFHRYNQFLLSISIEALFTSWIILLYSILKKDKKAVALDDNIFRPTAIFLYLIGLASILSYLRNFSFTHWIYLVLPIYIFNINANMVSSTTYNSLYSYARVLVGLCAGVNDSQQLRLMCSTVCTVVLRLGGFGLIVLLLVSVFSSRPLLSVIFLSLIAILIKQSQTNFQKKMSCLWICLCIILSVFPQLPTVGQYPYPSFCVAVSFSNSLLIYIISKHKKFANSRLHYQLHSTLHAVNTVVLIYMDYVRRSSSVPLLINIYSWILIPCTFILPLFSPKSAFPRIISWYSSISLPYSLLSLSYESIFLLTFLILLLVLIRLQDGFIDNNQYVISHSIRKRCCNDEGLMPVPSHFTESVLLLVLIEGAFFGTGNLASLNSFNPSFLRCFISVFSPFIMTALLVFKTVLPVFATAIAFVFILHSNTAFIVNLSCCILFISDAMAAVFFCRLVDHGSWLEIGMSISHYILSISLCVIIFAVLNLTCCIAFLSITSDFSMKHHRRIFSYSKF